MKKVFKAFIKIKTLKEILKQALVQSLVLFLIVEMSIFTLPAMAADGIVVDTSAPGNKPTLDTAPNGVAIVNLATTNSNGVSHNKFTDYNVGPGGVILNNSTTMGVSVLGGALYANPNYQNGRAASLVINEVTGNKRSNLLGYTEMFGKSADFILANPNGITINGAGFINMPRVTLGTGVPMWKSDRFTGLDIRGGDVIIEGAGVDAQSADYFTIVTRMASLSGPIWGKDVSIITGTGVYNYDDRVFTQQDTPDGKPEFAIDASALGSIYAGRISLVCNEKGVGVRSQSDLLADAGDISINADGNIIFKNVQAAKNINVAAGSGEIVQTGIAIAVEDLDYSASRITNTGSMKALNNLKLTGNLNNETGVIAATGNLDINTNGVLNNRNGQILQVENEAGTLNITGLDSINGSGGIIKSSGALTLGMTGDILLTGTEGTIYAGREFTLNATNVVNNIDLNMIGSIRINATGSVTANSGSRIVSNIEVNIASNSDISNSGTISGNSVNMRGSSLENNGEITGGEGNSRIDIAGNINNSGRISSASDLNINAANVTNTQALSEISSGQNLTITANRINNSGLLFSAANTEEQPGMTLNIAELNNTGTDAYIYSMGKMTINGIAATGNRLFNYSGHIESDGNMSINLGGDGKLENTGVDIGNYTLSVVSRSGYVNDQWVVLEETVLTQGNMRTVSGYIVSQNNMNITTGELKNHGSIISSRKDMAINANTLINETNTIEVSVPYFQHWGWKHHWRKRIKIGPASWTWKEGNDYSDYWTSTILLIPSNTKSVIQAGGNFTIDNQGGTVDNTGTIQAGGSVQLINSTSVNNGQNGSYTGLSDQGKQGNTTLSAFAILQNTGTIEVLQYVTLDGNGNAMFSLDTDPGSRYLVETRNQYIDVNSFMGSEYFFERIGFDPNHEMKLLGDAYYEQKLVMNAIYQTIAERYLSENIKSDKEEMQYLLDNAVTAYKDLKLSVGVELTKEQINSLQEPIIWYVETKVKGITVLAPKVYIPEHIIAGLTNNSSPKIAGGSVNMNITGGLTNSGIIQGKTSVNINAGNITNTTTGNMQAQISGGNANLTSSGDITNTGGVIKGENTLSLTAGGDIINETQINTTTYVHGDTVSTLGPVATIESKGTLTINAGGDFTNKGATIKAGGDAEIKAGGDINFETVKLHNVTHESRYGVNGVTDSTESVGSSLEVGGNLKMNSSGDTNFVGSNAEIAGNTDVKTGGNFNLLNDYNTDSFSGSKTSKNKTGTKKKTTTVSSYDVTVVGSSFKTGGNLNVDSSNDINIVGSNVEAGRDSKLYAEGTQNIIAVNDEHNFSKETKKSGFGQGGTIHGSEKKKDTVYDSRANSSNVDVKGKYASHSGKDTNIVGSNITANEAEITTGGNLNIVAAYDRHDEQHTTEKTGIGGGGGKNVYSMEMSDKGSGYTQAKGSVINAGKLTLNSGNDIYVEGSTINANDASIEAAGNFTETSAKNTSYNYEVHQTASITSASGMKDIAKSALTAGYTSRDQLQYKNGRFFVKAGEADYDKLDTKTDSTTQTSSNINAGNSLSIKAGKDITIAGSNINAGGDASLDAGGNVNIITAEEMSQTRTEHITGHAEVTVGAKNAYVDVGYAGKALLEAKKQLDDAKDSYKNYKRNLSKAKDDLAKGLIDQEDYESLAGQEKYFKANIALLAENLVAKTANLAMTTVSAIANSSHGGFTGDMQLDVSGSITKSRELSTNQIGSNILTGGNLSIKSGETAKIQGSNLASNGDMLIDAKNVEILAAQNTSMSTSDTKSAHINVTINMGGGGGFSADFGMSGNSFESATNINSYLSGNNITIKSAKDTTVRGGVVKAENSFDLNVGGNLLVESVQDTRTSSSHSFGLSGGASVSGGSVSGGNGGANFSVSESKSRWVNEQTSLTGCKVNIYVENKTTLKGAVIASTTNDPANLMIDTSSFEYVNIKDKSTSFNIGANVSVGGIGSNSKSYSAGANYGFSDKRQMNFATVGEGTIIVRNGNSDLSKLHRDVATAQYGTVDVGLSGGFVVDNKVVTLVVHPIQTTENFVNAIEKGYNDLKATTNELYQRTSNLIDSKGFYTDKGVQINESTEMWANGGMEKQIAGKYKEDIEGNFYKDSKDKTNEKLVGFYLLGLDNEGTILGDVLSMREGLKAMQNSYRSTLVNQNSTEYSYNQSQQENSNIQIIECGMFGSGRQANNRVVPSEPQLVQTNGSFENTMRDWAVDDNTLKNGTAGIYFSGKGFIGGVVATINDGGFNDVLESGVNYNPADASYERGKRIGTVVDAIVIAEGAFRAYVSKVIAGNASSEITTGNVNNQVTIYQKNAPDDGFLGNYRESGTLQPGEVISRIGKIEGGKYVSPPGTSLSERGLPSSYPNKTESLWEVVEPIKYEGGIAAPWRDASGMGVQQKLENTIQNLNNAGKIKPYAK